jgi:allophanate hydrolase subunit 2
MGPKLKFSHPVKIAICGALLSPKINNFPIGNNRVYKIEAGDELSFGKRQMGCRAYLAISGGFKTGKVLKSRSWFEGVTDNFKLNKTLKLPYESTNESKIETNASIKFTSEYLGTSEIDVFPGPEFDLLTEREQEILRSHNFSIDKNNNRMAIQLREIMGNSLKPIITGPVLPGTVQLTPSGKLIVLMRDCQTTGGYPRVIQLSETGMNKIAQKIIGDSVSFAFLG